MDALASMRRLVRGDVFVLVGGAIFKGAEDLVSQVGLTRRNACCAVVLAIQIMPRVSRSPLLFAAICGGTVAEASSRLTAFDQRPMQRDGGVGCPSPGQV
jgi:hypothetical protein